MGKMDGFHFELQKTLDERRRNYFHMQQQAGSQRPFSAGEVGIFSSVVSATPWVSNILRPRKIEMKPCSWQVLAPPLSHDPDPIAAGGCGVASDEAW
jgi:hypothetical protein